MPQISVIVPVYKVEPYLRRCVDSILAQTFTDFELILVDDGSPDNCGAICDEYAAKDPRVRVIHKENGGLSSARNAGMDVAEGEYIMFCDSDDVVAAEWCEKLYNTICDAGSLLVFSNVNIIKANDVQATCAGVPSGIVDSYFQMYRMGLSGFTVNKIYRYDILRKYSIRFDEDCRYGEDVQFNVSYCKHCSGLYYCEERLYNYYQNAESILHRYYPDLFELNLHLFNERLPLLECCDISEYCDIHVYYFISWLDNTMDQRNSMSFWEKMRYNHEMMNTEEFRFCVANATGKNDSPLFMKVVRTHNYYIYWLFQKLMKIKDRLLGR